MHFRRCATQTLAVEGTQHNGATRQAWRGKMQCATRRIVACIAIVVMAASWATHDLTRGSARDPAYSGSGSRGMFVNAQTTNCTQPATYTGNRTVNIAMLFWGPPADDLRFTSTNGSARIVWTRNPMLDGWNGPSSVEIRFYRPYQLWQERMELPSAYGGGPGLILLDGSVMRFNITWFNVGEFKALRGPGEFTPQYQNSWANKLITQLADANGPYGRQHFLLSPLISNSQVTILASLACEASGTCMMVSPGAAESRQFICQDPMPQDCLQRGRRKGSRRFENTVSAYSNADYWASGSMSLVVNQGFKRIFAIGEMWSIPALVQMAATAKLLGMRVVGNMTIATLTQNWSDYNTSSAEITQRIQSLDVDMVVVLNTFEGTTALHDLLRYWRSIGFLPNAVAYLTGGASYLPPDLAAYFLVEVHWLPTLTGAQYRAVSSETNFEAFPSNVTHDSPAVFADAFTERFGYRPSNNIFFDSVRALHAVTIVQKLLELAQTEDTESLKSAAARIAAPAVFHTVQFDQWGRSLPFDNYVLQLMPEGEAHILTPLGLGSTPIFPIPGWSEREYHPVFLKKTSDRIAFGLSVVTSVYIVCWLVWLILHWHHPLIRVADPLSSSFSLCGLLVLSSSCFFAVALQTDATCAAFMWLFMPGVTLSFAPLMLKNLRIWSLWRNSASLSPSPIKQLHLVLVLAVRMMVDFSILTIWMLVTGMNAHRHIPDPYRPALDYYSCDYYQHAGGYVFALMSWKFLILSLAMYLAYLLRNVSSKYSESRFIALCVYNVTVVLAIFVPVSATNAAGHAGTQLLRIYLIIFLCVSTASIMFVPKLVAIRRCPPPIENTSWSRRHKTQAETESPSPVDGGAAAGAEAAGEEAATDPRANSSNGQSGPFPDGAPVAMHGHASQRTVDLRGPEWHHSAPPQQRQDSSLAFQSMIGLSQVERRYVEEESEMTQSRDPRARTQATRVPCGQHNQTRQQQRRPPGIGMSSPAPLLDVIPQSPQCSSRSLSTHSGSDSGSNESTESLLRSTLDLIHSLPSNEVAQLHSSLIRRRQSTSSSSGEYQPQQQQMHSYSHSHPSPALSVRLPHPSVASVTINSNSAGLGSGSSDSSGAASGSAGGAGAGVSTGSSSGSGGDSSGSAVQLLPVAFPRVSPPLPPPLPAQRPPSHGDGSTIVEFAPSFEDSEQEVVSFYEE